VRRRLPIADQGFTIIELVVVVAILPLVMGALALGLVAVFKLQGNVALQLGNAGDTQASTAVLNADVTSAQFVTTNPVPTTPSGTSPPLPCGSGTQALGLSWNSTNTLVSYDYVPTSAGNGDVNLVRTECDAGATPTTQILAYHVLTALPTTLAVTCSATAPTCTTGTSAIARSWIAATSVAAFAYTIAEKSANAAVPYTFTLNAAPETSNSTPAVSLGAPGTVTNCNFALPGTGTYASQLCFMNFALLNTPSNLAAARSAAGLNIVEAVPGGYSLSFNVQIQGASVVPAGFPTWTGAFLGNNVNGGAFYTGVGCPSNTPTTTLISGVVQGTPSCQTYPTLYQNSQSTQPTVVTFTNISLTAPGNVLATGYEVVAADGETTDPNEYIQFQSNLNFRLLPNTPTSVMGNACNTASYTTTSAGDLTPQSFLTGGKTKSVYCSSTFQSSGTYKRTGTLMVGVAPTPGVPTTLQATFKGAGLEGVSFGVRVP